MLLAAPRRRNAYRVNIRGDGPGLMAGPALLFGLGVLDKRARGVVYCRAKGMRFSRRDKKAGIVTPVLD